MKRNDISIKLNQLSIKLNHQAMAERIEYVFSTHLPLR